MIRDYSSDDYPMLCEWWNAQKFPCPPEQFLAGTGYISNESAAGFLYLTNSTISWMEFVVVNPKADKALRNESINEVVEHICKQAKFIGSIIVFTSISSWPFKERLKGLGFEVGEEGMTNLIKRVI